MVNSASLYFHIPFCTKKCPYCHFYVIPNKASFRSLLKDALKLEWEQQLPLLSGVEIKSIYFGGGTPTLFGAEEIGAVLERVRASGLDVATDCEITIEANPEEGAREFFAAFRAAGVNRLSLGVQSLDDRSLLTLERIHSAEKAKEAIWNAKEAGFENVSIDLMYDLPGQTEESWLYTLGQLETLPIQHLSLYNLTIEPHTSFHKRGMQAAHGELSLRFLHLALEAFEKIGLARYEISAFCKPGFESRHNLGYWTARPFLGFGPSAFSYWNGERFRNIANIQRYARALQNKESPVDFHEALPYPANVLELLAVRLRLVEGVDLSPLNLPAATFQTLDKWTQAGYLARTDSHLRLTERGQLFYDTIASEIV